MKQKFIRHIRFGILLSSALSLSACGFTPVHAPGLGSSLNGGPSIGLSDFHITIPPRGEIRDEQAAFYVLQNLRDRMGVDGSRFELSIDPEIRRLGIGVRSDDVETRFDMRIRLNYRISDPENGDILDRGDVTAVASFGASLDPYGRTAAEESAVRQVSSEAADRLIVRVAGFLANYDPQDP